MEVDEAPTLPASAGHDNDIEIAVTGEGSAPADATPQAQQLAELRGKVSPSVLCDIDWKALRRAGGGDLPAVDSAVGAAVAALRNALFQAMFCSGLSHNELFVCFTPDAQDGKSKLMPAAALQSQPPVAVQLVTNPRQVRQFVAGWA